MNNINYINQTLYKIANSNASTLDELPYTYDPYQYMFEIQFKVYIPKDNKIITSTLPLSPQMVLIGYIQGDQKATMMFRDAARFLNIESVDTTASFLATMVTPNLQPKIWIKDLEHEGYLITPLYLTISEMQNLIYFENIDKDPYKFVEKVRKRPKIFDFVPFLDTTRIDHNKVYVTDTIKLCSKRKAEEKKEQENIKFLDIR